MVRYLVCCLSAAVKSKSLLVAENLCLRQQLVVLKRRQARPWIRYADRRFWVLVCGWFSNWRDYLVIVKPDTVVRWHRIGWKAHWRRRSRRLGKAGRKPIGPETRRLIRRMAQENPLSGQRRIQAELARLGIRVCARTVAKYMGRRHGGTPSPSWRQFLAQHGFEIWACDLLTVQTLWFRSLFVFFVFFVIHHGTRQIVHTRVTARPNEHWLAQQIVEACGPDTAAPRFLIHDRDRCFGTEFDRRVASLGIRQVRTPVKAPKANAIAERWVRSIRNDCLDHRLIFGRRHLQRTVHDYASYYNRWRPHRSLSQRSPCRAPCEPRPAPGNPLRGKPILGGLHHVYHWAA